MSSNLFPVCSGYLYLYDDRKHKNCFLGNCTGNNTCGGNISHWAVISIYLRKVKYTNPVKCGTEIRLFIDLFVCTKDYLKTKKQILNRNMNKKAHKHTNSWIIFIWQNWVESLLKCCLGTTGTLETLNLDLIIKHGLIP